MSINEDSIDEYFFIKDIGEGNFGKVKLGVKRKTGEKYAIKIMNKEKIQMQMGKTLIPEIEISKKFNHKNVIRVYSILEDHSNYYIIMEYCSKGELFDYIVSKIKLTKEESSLFFYQLINGMEYIHSMGFAHRDLKPENLLLTHNNILKIIDFGLTHEYNDNMLLHTKCGSPSYAAPEVLKGNKYDGFKSDIWCCGIILYAMLSGFLPFEGENNKILFRNIIKCEYKLEQFEDEEIKQLIKKILNPNPILRISINEIKKNDFYLMGEKLFYKIENSKKNSPLHSNNKKYLKLKNCNKNSYNPNSRRINKNNAYKIFDKLSTDRAKKFNINLLYQYHTNDNSLNKESKKMNVDKKSLDMRIFQTSKNAEEIISRHSNKNNLKINSFLKIVEKHKRNNFNIKYNLNDKIKILLKKNNSEEDKDKNLEIEKSIPKIRKSNHNYIIDCNNSNNNSNNENNNNNVNIKVENLDSLSIKSKINNCNGYDDRSKSLNAKNKLRKHNNIFNNELITTEPFTFMSKGKKNYINKNKKSYNLYKVIDNTDKLTKSYGLKLTKMFYTENSKLHKKKVIDLRNKEIVNQYLPLLKHK